MAYTINQVVDVLKINKLNSVKSKMKLVKTNNIKYNINTLLFGFIIFSSSCSKDKCETRSYNPNELKIEWVDIPGGTFIMGSPESELKRDADEIQYQVTLTGFRMSKYEITFDQYDAFCEATCRVKADDFGRGRGNKPVTGVTWNDANAFADFVGARLPTEAEWEFACRAKTTTPFHFGENITAMDANINTKYPYIGEPIELTIFGAKAVGSYLPNSRGLYDMHGNVSEYCSDWYGPYNLSETLNPKGPSNGSGKVFRGGSWVDFVTWCRSASRNSGEIGVGAAENSTIGIRLVAK